MSVHLFDVVKALKPDTNLPFEEYRKLYLDFLGFFKDGVVFGDCAIAGFGGSATKVGLGIKCNGSMVGFDKICSSPSCVCSGNVDDFGGVGECVESGSGTSASKGRNICFDVNIADDKNVRVGSVSSCIGKGDISESECERKFGSSVDCEVCDIKLMGGNQLVKGQAGYWKQQRDNKKRRKRERLDKMKENQEEIMRSDVGNRATRLDSIKKKKNWRRMEKDDRHGVSQVSEGEDLDLKSSLRRKWMAENELAALKAERAIEVTKQMDFDAQVKRAATKLRLEIEKNMVGIEKTHATLRATGNVPGVVGSVETVLDSTISPDSSASMQEFRRVQKQCLDLQEKIERMEKRFGVDSDDLDFLEKRTYTDTSENHRKLLKYVPGDFGIIPVGEGDDGKNYFKVEILGGDVY